MVIKSLATVLMLLGLAANGVAASNEGPPCLLGLCIGSGPILERDALERLSLPATKQRLKDGIDYDCFRWPKKRYLKLGIMRPDSVVVSVGLSSFDDCEGNSTDVQNSIREETTLEGLHLGDSRQDVLRIYGSPEAIIKDQSTFDRWLNDRKRPSDHYRNLPLVQLFIYGPPERQGEFRVIGFDRHARVTLLLIYAGP